MDENSLPTVFPIARVFAAAVVVACAVACVRPTAFAQSRTITIPIEETSIGSMPAGFEFKRTGQGAPGRWAVVSDSTTNTGRAIEQSSTDQTDSRFPLAIYRPVSAKNVEVSVRFKPVAGTVDRAGGIAVRVIDSDNYYVARANALEDNVRFYRVTRGSRREITGADTKVSANEWHTLSLKVDGERFTITFDDKQLFTVTDRSIAGAGNIALWTKADSVTRFDRIEIRMLP